MVAVAAFILMRQRQRRTQDDTPETVGFYSADTSSKKSSTRAAAAESPYAIIAVRPATVYDSAFPMRDEYDVGEISNYDAAPRNSLAYDACHSPLQT